MTMSQRDDMGWHMTANALRKGVLAALLLLALVAGGAVSGLRLRPPLEAEPLGHSAESLPEAVRILDAASRMSSGHCQDLDCHLARELLDMLDKAPGMERYTVAMRSGDARHVLTAEFRGGAVIRRVEMTGESARTLVYQGFVRHRVQAAACGGSLEETPVDRDSPCPSPPPTD